jgi:hypothetical protein
MSKLFVVLLVQAGADGQRVIGIHGTFVELDVLDFSFLVHDDGGAPRPFEIVALNGIFFQDAIIDEDLAIHVAQERHRDADLFGEGGVCGGAVYTDSEDDGVTGFEFGLISLIGLEFLRSTTCESQDVESENDIFLAAEIAQLDRFPFVAEKGEIRGGVAHFQGRLGNGFVLRCCRELSRHQQQKKTCECQDASLHLRSFEKNQPARGLYALGQRCFQVYERRARHIQFEPLALSRRINLRCWCENGQP